MKTEWDYTNLAEAYLKRPEYASEAIQKMFEITRVGKNFRGGVSSVCDVGAGAAHLTLELAKEGLDVYAVEPNDAMRANGMNRTKEYPNVKWFEGVGENTGMESNFFDLVTFGSSFNVCDRQLALKETDRILKPGGYFACMWNHRDLEDPLQKGIEDIIKQNIDDYSYGTRREEQTEVINQSGLFQEVQFVSGRIEHTILAEDFIEGWKSHGTVYRQSKEVFDKINREIRAYVESYQKEYIVVPYTTRIWIARSKK